MVVKETKLISSAELEKSGLKPSFWKVLQVLFKVRLDGLLLFAAVGGAFLAAGEFPPVGPLALLLVVVAAATVVLLFLNVRLIARPDVEVARRLFHVSKFYLGIILLMICVEVAFIEWH